jgi:hypothetical protein
MKGWDWAVANPDEAAMIVLENDETGAQTEKHQKRMMGEIAKLVGQNPKGTGWLDEAAYERTVETLMGGGSDPVIKKPVVRGRDLKRRLIPVPAPCLSEGCGEASPCRDREPRARSYRSMSGLEKGGSIRLSCRASPHALGGPPGLGALGDPVIPIVRLVFLMKPPVGPSRAGRVIGRAWRGLAGSIFRSGICASPITAWKAFGPTSTRRSTACWAGAAEFSSTVMPGWAGPARWLPAS